MYKLRLLIPHCIALLGLSGGRGVEHPCQMHVVLVQRARKERLV